MASRDLTNNIEPALSINPAATTATATGSGVDTAGYESVCVMFVSGTKTDGTHTPKVQESDDNSSFSDVAAADQVGTLSAIASNAVQRVGYKGGKRYVRGVITVSGATTGAVESCTVLLGHPRVKPTA